MSIAVIADIVGSRLLSDRSVAQGEIERAIDRAHDVGPQPVAPMRATFADEFQAVFADLDSAVTWLLLLQLALPEGVALRFGVGIGDVGPVESAAGTALSDGSGWWRAREAIEHVHRLSDRQLPSARTWIVGGEEEDAAMASRIRSMNAYLLARDQLVGAMSDRARRLTLGRCLGQTQRELARAEGITQSAVSQALVSAGTAAVVGGFALLTGGAT